ncbi:hypothetical protein JW930_05205 [Candidatus Woesearchaeota archaeon]|nr:hypothetical protein [Candidatus Woesearchaeota archaeon]
MGGRWGYLYNKCNKCGKMLEDKEQRKLVLDPRGNISTRCMDCYSKKIKKRG